MSIFFRLLVAALIAGTSIAMPGPVQYANEHKLDNGNTTVSAITVDRDTRSVDSALFRRDNVNCEGSAFCELLGSSCDDAKRKVSASNVYSTFDGAENSGTCSGTCGLFVGSPHCQATGQELIDAFTAIRTQGSCTHCGQFIRASDGCVLKIDRVLGCP